jgi:putative transposase
LIRRLAQENTGWGAPRIHGELQKLGFILSERTVARYLSRTPRSGDAAKKWLAFLHNHREAIVAFDFFTVPTASFRVLYCFFVIEHERRRILHFNVTRHPSADWVVQQLRETFPEAAPYRYAILDHDSIFNGDVIGFLAVSQTNEHSRPMAKRNGRKMDWELPPRDPRPHHPGERRTPSSRHPRVVCYHHEDRVHDSLDKDTPSGRPIEPRPVADATLTALPRLGGLHHRYTWRQAA